MGSGTYILAKRGSELKLMGFSREENSPDGSGTAFFTDSGSSSDTAWNRAAKTIVLLRSCAQDEPQDVSLLADPSDSVQP